MKKGVNSSTIKKYAIPVLFLLFMITVISYNIQTYYSIRRNAGYTIGVIKEIEFDDGAKYVEYEYDIDGKKEVGKQAGELSVGKKVLIVYDTTAYEYSMIATYPLPILIDSNDRIIKLDTSLVNYKWGNYLPHK